MEKENMFLIDLVAFEATIMDAIYEANPNISEQDVTDIVTRVYHNAIDNNRLLNYETR